jgi:hypothetical protein
MAYLRYMLTDAHTLVTTLIQLAYLTIQKQMVIFLISFSKVFEVNFHLVLVCENCFEITEFFIYFTHTHTYTHEHSRKNNITYFAKLNDLMQY